MAMDYSFRIWKLCHTLHITPLPTFKGGFYIFNLLENYAAGLSLLVTVFFEAIAVSWFYGLRFNISISSVHHFVAGTSQRTCMPCSAAGPVLILFQYVVISIKSRPRFGKIDWNGTDSNEQASTGKYVGSSSRLCFCSSSSSCRWQKCQSSRWERWNKTNCNEARRLSQTRAMHCWNRHI